MREGDHFVLYNALRLRWQCESSFFHPICNVTIALEADRLGLGKNDRNEEPADPAAASEAKAKKPIKPTTKFATEHGLREEALYEAVDLAKTLRSQAGMKGMRESSRRACVSSSKLELTHQSAAASVNTTCPRTSTSTGIPFCT